MRVRQRRRRRHRPASRQRQTSCAASFASGARTIFCGAVAYSRGSQQSARSAALTAVLVDEVLEPLEASLKRAVARLTDLQSVWLYQDVEKLLNVQLVRVADAHFTLAHASVRTIADEFFGTLDREHWLAPGDRPYVMRVINSIHEQLRLIVQAAKRVPFVAEALIQHLERVRIEIGTGEPAAFATDGSDTREASAAWRANAPAPDSIKAQWPDAWMTSESLLASPLRLTFQMTPNSSLVLNDIFLDISFANHVVHLAPSSALTVDNCVCRGRGDAHDALVVVGQPHGDDECARDTTLNVQHTLVLNCPQGLLAARSTFDAPPLRVLVSDCVFVSSRIALSNVTSAFVVRSVIVRHERAVVVEADDTFASSSTYLLFDRIEAPAVNFFDSMLFSIGNCVFVVSGECASRFCGSLWRRATRSCSFIAA